MAEESRQKKGNSGGEAGGKKKKEQKAKSVGSDAKKRALRLASGNESRNRLRRNTTIAKKGDPTGRLALINAGVPKEKIAEITAIGEAAIEKRAVKKIASAAKPEVRELHKANKLARKLRQAARRGNLEALELLGEDPAYFAIKHEGRMAAAALEGSAASAEVLGKVFPETYKALKVRINEAIANAQKKETETASEAS